MTTAQLRKGIRANQTSVAFQLRQWIACVQSKATDEECDKAHKSLTQALDATAKTLNIPLKHRKDILAQAVDVDSHLRRQLRKSKVA